MAGPLVSGPGRRCESGGMRGRATARSCAVLAAAAFALSACARANLPQNTLAPRGPQAEKIDDLFQPVFWIAVAVFVLVEGGLVYLLVHYRHRAGRGVPAQVHGNKRLEVTWTVIPAVLLAVTEAKYDVDYFRQLIPWLAAKRPSSTQRFSGRGMRRLFGSFQPKVTSNE